MRYAAWLAILVLTLGGCSSAPDEPTDKPTAKPLPEAARQVMTTALETMFSWDPATDSGPGAAFARADQYLTQSAQDANKAFALETATGWAKWKQDGATLEADVTIGDKRPTDAPADTDQAVTRSAKVAQRLVGADGGTTETFDFTLDQVVAVENDGKWLVQSISNVDRAGGGLCPPGEIEQHGACLPEPTTIAPTTTSAAPAPPPPPAPQPIRTTTTTVAPPPPPPQPVCTYPMEFVPGSGCMCPLGSQDCGNPAPLPPDPECPAPQEWIDGSGCTCPPGSGDCLNPPPYDPNNCDPGLMCLRSRPPVVVPG